MGEDVMRRHGVYCGSRLPGLITSEGNSLRVEFNSDNSVQKSGFAAVFFTGNIIHIPMCKYIIIY
jgi:CUB domain.